MTPTLFATLKYQDARKAMTWMADAFDLQLGTYSPESGDTVDHAEMFHGNGGIMFGSMQDNEYPLAAASGSASQAVGIYIIVEDIDAHYARAQAAGAEMVIDLQNTEYGSREYTARDFEGHLWSFGTYQPDGLRSESLWQFRFTQLARCTRRGEQFAKPVGSSGKPQRRESQFPPFVPAELMGTSHLKHTG